MLRDDTPRLGMAMAGALSHYAAPRSRAVITLEGLEPWSGLVGTVLRVHDLYGDTSSFCAPITSVSWEFGGEASEGRPPGSGEKHAAREG